MLRNIVGIFLMLIFTFFTIYIYYATWKQCKLESGWLARTLLTLDIVKWIILLRILCG